MEELIWLHVNLSIVHDEREIEEIFDVGLVPFQQCNNSHSKRVLLSAIFFSLAVVHTMFLCLLRVYRDLIVLSQSAVPISHPLMGCTHVNILPSKRFKH